jgi:hypothetical protein
MPKARLSRAEKAVLLELARRGTVKPFRLEDFLFAEQLKFIEDPANYATACCSRRSGKTVAAAAALIHEAISRPKVNCLYITLARSNAKKLIWPELLEINREYALGGVPNTSDLSITFRNGSVIYCSGAKDKKEIEKFRGIGNLVLCIIDESQSFGSYIEELIEDVISKALFDYNGKLRLLGTPGKVPTGYFYDACHSSQWSSHKWTMHQNPWLLKKSGKTPEQLIQEDLQRTGLTLNSPRVLRECFGQWATDLDSLVFRYQPEINHYEELPQGNWRYVIGIDIGYLDADAIAVLGWTEHDNTVYLVEEFVQAKQGITELIDTVTALVQKYRPINVVMDTGGSGGRKLQEEINKRYRIGIQAADKANKNAHIEILNDALRTGRFKAKKGSKFAEDALQIEWNRDKSTPDRLVISDRFHSDIVDAVQYAHTAALAYLAKPEPKAPPKPHTPEWYQVQQEEMRSRTQALALKQKQAKQDDGLWSKNIGLSGVGSWDGSDL